MAEENDLRFPIGKFDREEPITPAMREQNIRKISDLPGELVAAVSGLGDSRLDTEYRPGGWTVRQTIHHVADSHLNAMCRFKLALTEENPIIRPYAEEKWAELADSRMPIEISLKIIEGIHARWTRLLTSMTDTDFSRPLVHPDSGRWTLDEMLALYGWHSLHHTAHITKLRERRGWFMTEIFVME